MRIALVAPPFIPVPPRDYGGTELFVAQLAEGLAREGVDVVVYANGESRVDAEVRWLYERSYWPIASEVYDNLKDLNHTAWAVADAARACDLVHVNNITGLVCSRFVEVPMVYTIHHPHEPELSEFYSFYPQVQYVTISDFQRCREAMPLLRTIHHGVDVQRYRLGEAVERRSYLVFLGRVAPPKGTHLAIEVARRSGIPLKIAGEIQPRFRDYWEQQVRPHVDGRFIEYVGQVGLEEKNQLLGGALALLFPIQWDEPFGLVMIEAMACGAPVLALPGGSVPEVVADGVSGFICPSVDALAERAAALPGRFDPAAVRRYVEQHFPLERMLADYLELYLDVLERPRAAAAGEPHAVA